MAIEYRLSRRLSSFGFRPGGYQLRAYIVFAGGGIKGAAHAGCLAAAQDANIDLVGFGGTSAGSIVALLGTVGYTGHEIGRLMIEKDFSSFLDDKGVRLKSAIENATGLQSKWTYWKYSAYKKLGKTFANSLGLYRGDELTAYLWGLVRNKCELKGDDPFGLSFDDLEAQNLPQFKVVATDITRKRAAVFPDDCHLYGKSVMQAVRASAGYPFVFHPVNAGGAFLVDGGVASNLPSFLFAEESQRSRLPTLAFDLVSNKLAAITDILSFAKETFYTCLEASDKLLCDVSTSIVHIPTELSPEFDSLDFDIGKNEREALFNAGYRCANQFFASYAPLVHSRASTENRQKTLMAQFGDPRRFEPVLWALIRDIQDFSTASDCRANIMLTTGRGTRIIVYQVNMEDHNDIDLEIDETAGCSGYAWQKKIPMVADLDEARKNPTEWGMSEQQHSKVPTCQRSMISVPIPGRDGEFGPNDALDSAPIGTLSLDSRTPLVDTSWLDGSDIKTKIIEIMQSWAYIVARLLG